MEITRNTTPSLPATKTDVTVSGNADRDQAAKNAMSLLQARYGEKPKEQRAVHKTLDKDDFMKIMINEMKHQDPTKPMDADKMATQMAQLTTVEQMKNVSASIDKLVEKNNGADRLAMSAMIGKTVTVDKGKFAHTKGQMSALNFTLPEDAEKVKLTVLDDKGEEVFSRELEPQKAGTNVFNWDGVASNGVGVKSGAYAIRIDAENAKGGKIKTDPIAHESIVGVSFDAGDTNFLIGDPKQPQKIPMRNVIKIEGDALVRVESEKKAKLAAERLKNSENGVDPESEAKEKGFELPPELRERVEAEAAAKAAAAADSPLSNSVNVASADPKNLKATQAEENVKPEGFANGLSDQ